MRTRIWGIINRLAIGHSQPPTAEPDRFANITSLNQPDYAYLGNSIGIVKVLSKYHLYVDTRDVGLTPHLIIDGYWELWITRFIASVVSEGMSVVDIGANYGYYTLLMADLVGPKGSVLAFEPNRHLNAMLKDSCRINGFGRVTDIRMEAVGRDQNKTAYFAVPCNDPKNGLVLAEHEVAVYQQKSDFAIYEVNVTSLDALGELVVDFIKIDAEGAEFDIWHGMKETLRNNAGIQILMEFNIARYPDRWEAFYDDILEEGFLVKHIDFDAQPKPLSKQMIRTERQGEDWMLYLRRAEDELGTSAL